MEICWIISDKALLERFQCWQPLHGFCLCWFWVSFVLKNTLNYLWSFPFIIIWQSERVLCCAPCLHLAQGKASKFRRISLITHLSLDLWSVQWTGRWTQCIVAFCSNPKIQVCVSPVAERVLGVFHSVWFLLLWGKKMWLKNSHSCSSCQSGGFLTQPNRGVLRKSLLSTEVKGGIHVISAGRVSHTQTLFFNFCFILPARCSFFKPGHALEHKGSCW